MEDKNPEGQTAKDTHKGRSPDRALRGSTGQGGRDLSTPGREIQCQSLSSAHMYHYSASLTEMRLLLASIYLFLIIEDGGQLGTKILDNSKRTAACL